MPCLTQVKTFYFWLAEVTTAKMGILLYDKVEDVQVSRLTPETCH